MKLIFNLIVALPEIIKLLQTLQKAIDEAKTNKKVEDDLKAIQEAFDARDPEKLAAIFNSK